jgi:carboxymethylenebutenolidase
VPEGEGTFPGVLVIQEWWGLVPHIKEVADRFAREGYVALAPDLYHGKATSEPDEAGKLMMSLQREQAGKDLNGAVNFLLGHERVAGSKVGVVGFCMGGGLALYEACHYPDKIGACVDFYGVLMGEPADLKSLQAPLLGLFAEKDGYMGPAQVRQLEEQLKSLGKQAEFHIYPGADHAFFNDTRPEVYDKDAADDAWRRTLAFFGQHLK